MEDVILKETETNESKSAVNILEIEQVVDSLEDVDVKADPEENVRVTPGVAETNNEKETTAPTAKRADFQDFGKKFRNLSKLVTEDGDLAVNTSEAEVDDNFNHASLPFDPGIKSKEESSTDAKEEIVELSSST